MSKKSEAVKKWRKENKKRIIESMGSKCQICHYDKCNEALELHHINPDKKEFSFGKITASPKAWSKMVIELRKCVLLCANCHRELHNNLTSLPKKFKKFDENYVTYKEVIKSYCPVCGNEKKNFNKACSVNCAATLARKVNWDDIDLKSLIGKHSYCEIGDMLNVSDVAVRKRAIKLGLV